MGRARRKLGKLQITVVLDLDDIDPSQMTDEDGRRIPRAEWAEAVELDWRMALEELYPDPISMDVELLEEGR